METNIIKAIINMVQNPIAELKSYYKSINRANGMGESFEEFVKDIFANTITETDEQKRLKEISKAFVYLGNQNNPPDSILRGGDAIEVKKIESERRLSNSSIPLNSSYPKAKLCADSSMITSECRNCEHWKEKDIIYAFGVISKNSLINFAMVYGVDYAAESQIYERIRETIVDGIKALPDVEFAETNELARINRVDPLGITYFRIRGMWGIENPFKVFNYIYKRDADKDFNFMALINTDKYISLQYTDELESLSKRNTNLEIKDVEIKDPNNPAKLKKAKLITFNR